MLSHLLDSTPQSISLPLCTNFYFDRPKMEVAEPSAAKPTTKVAALCGSLRKGSFNRSLLRAAMKISESIEGLEIECIDISPLPMLNTDLEVGGRFPPVVEAFREKIRASDCVLFASPEYNYSVTALNDWMDHPMPPPGVPESVVTLVKAVNQATATFQIGRKNRPRWTSEVRMSLTEGIKSDLNAAMNTDLRQVFQKLGIHV